MTGALCGVLPREERLDRCERTERRLDLVEDGPRVDLPGGEPWKPPVLMDRVCFRLDSMRLCELCGRRWGFGRHCEHKSVLSSFPVQGKFQWCGR